MNKKKKERLTELGKDVLILLLACSAVYMGANALVVGGLSSLFEKTDAVSTQQITQREPSSVAWPVRMVISGWNGETMMRHGVQYDRAACETQFQPVASLLREALSELGVAQKVTRLEWERALSINSSLYFDLLGEVPLSVLSGWLSGMEHPAEGTVRRLFLAAEGKHVFLYYQDAVSGGYYMRVADVVSAEQIRAVTDGVMGNGALFAFEAEGYDELDGDTLLLPEQPQPTVYASVNPVAGAGQVQVLDPNSNFAKLLTALSFPDNSYIYSGTDQVVRSGNDTLRISAQGIVRYSVAEGEPSRYPVSARGGHPTAFEAAEACRSLADDAVGGMAGAARLYLKQIRQTDTGWQVEFAYSLDGARVQVGDSGYAAHFEVEGSEITQFELQLRSYTATDTSSIVLPERQAAAAMQSMTRHADELLLAYRDTGAGEVRAVWTAN